MVKEANTVIGVMIEEIGKETSCSCKVCDFHVMFWSPHLKIVIPEVEKLTEKVARFGIVREEQGTGNWELIV